MKKALKRVGICLGALVGAVVLFVGALFVMNQWTGDTKPIIAMADRFKPASGWTLSGENIQPPRMYCVGNVPCPMLARSWETETPVSKDGFEEFAETANLPVENLDCIDHPEELSNGTTFCSANVRNDIFEAELSASKWVDGTYVVSLYVKETSK